MKIEDTLSSVYPICYNLFYYLPIFALNTACVERLFSKMKLIKIWEITESKYFGESTIYCNRSTRRLSDDHYKHFVNELKRLNPNMRIKLCWFLWRLHVYNIYLTSYLNFMFLACAAVINISFNFLQLQWVHLYEM